MDINIENETIEIAPNDWKDEAQLKDEIQAKIEIGNYDVVNEATALKKLTETLATYTKIDLKLPTNFIEESNGRAEEKGVTFEEYLRKLLNV